jgi:hypothetical protein
MIAANAAIENQVSSTCVQVGIGMRRRRFDVEKNFDKELLVGSSPIGPVGIVGYLLMSAGLLSFAVMAGSVGLRALDSVHRESFIGGFLALALGGFVFMLGIASGFMGLRILLTGLKRFR